MPRRGNSPVVEHIIASDLRIRLPQNEKALAGADDRLMRGGRFKSRLTHTRD
jgi:hypothetical protein